MTTTTHDDCWRHDPCYDGDDENCPPRVKERRQHAKALEGAWSLLELRKTESGWRHFVDGEPVHCGETLELQHVEYRYEENGDERLHYKPAGTRVRYEAGLTSTEEPRVLLYAGVGGHCFALEAHSGMRFRWPK